MMRPASFRPLAAVVLVAMGIAASASPLSGTSVSAKDLGVRGATWPVAEPDLLAEIEARLEEMQRSGALAGFEAEARERARRRLEEPDPVPGIAPARLARSRTFDPSIEVARDIRAHDGTLIAAAGTRIDPFAHAPLTRDLLFVDGRRDAEIDWALAHARPAKTLVPRIVLLAGRPLDLARRHGHPFFFDQGGRLAARFGIAVTPSLVTRDDTRAGGALLRIDEIPLDDAVEDGKDTRAGDTRAGDSRAGDTRAGDGQ